MLGAEKQQPIAALGRADTGGPIVRAYESGDEHAVVKLLGAPFDGDVGLEHWRWKLTHWPSNAPNVWLADCDGTAVFHYGGIPLRYTANGSAATAMISVDAMTAPEFRRRGLLTQGATLAFSEWRARGIAFTLGLPNERWGSRIGAVGWQKLFPLQWLVQPLRPEVFAARRLGIAWLRRATVLSDVWRRLRRNRLHRDSRIEFREVAQADGAFDSLWDRCRSDAMFSTVRDRAWVQWRFLSAPTRKYDVVLACRHDAAVGYYAMHIASTQHKTSAFLAELVAPAEDEAARDSLLAEALTNAYDAGADILATLAVPGTSQYASLRRAGFMRGPSFGVHIVPFAAELSMDRLSRPENWLFSGAEFDVV